MIRFLFRSITRGALWTIDLIARLTGRHKPYNTLQIELTGHIAEAGVLGFLPFRRPTTPDLFGLTTLLRWAREDEQLSAVVLTIDHLDTGWARLQNLRRSIQALRHAGKYVLVYLAEGGTQEYYLASAANAVAMAPAGHLTVTGLAAETMFFKGALDKLGIQAQVSQAGQYKSAGEPFTRTSLSEPHREMMNSLLDDLYDQIVEGVSATRNTDTATVRELIDQGLFLPHEAQEVGLIDHIGYEDDIPHWLESRGRPEKTEEKGRAAAVNSAESDPNLFIEAGAYLRRRGRLMRRRALRYPPVRMAFMTVGGTITRGETETGSDGIQSSGSASMIRDLRHVRDDPGIAGVLIRVSSPGGSGLASDLVWHEILQTKEEKPVIISLGDVAASGGYYIALAGTTVFAEEGTITGSIGVIAGKAVLHGLYAQLGLDKEILTRGKRAALFSDYLAFGPAEQERMDIEIQSFYQDFVKKVAQCRSLSYETVDACAQGRVWSGRQAAARGLVDQIGGLEEALAELKYRVGLPDHWPVGVERFPKPASLLRFPSLLRLLPWGGRVHGTGWSWERDRVWAILPFSLRFL
ncbi:MAG: signal peptide peptidase SppA [Desulfurellaceae bacterium]|nr:signal peptide peptidase SppA [Desulfurellaceae bacterium]